MKTIHKFLQVDELMRQELRNLKIAIDKEKQKRLNKKAKIARPKKRRGVMKDLTKDRYPNQLHFNARSET